MSDIILILFLYHRKICSKLQVEIANAKSLLAENEKRENEKEKSLTWKLTEIEKNQNKMEGEWRLALGDFGSSNCRNRKKQEKSLLELAGLVSGISRCLGGFARDLKVLGSQNSEEQKKVS